VARHRSMLARAGCGLRTDPCVGQPSRGGSSGAATRRATEPIARARLTAVTVVRLGEILEAAVAGGGVHWTLPDPDDLDANLVRLRPGSGIAAHVNTEVDVAIVVLAGSGELVIDGVSEPLEPATFAVVPKATERAITAGVEGLSYVTIHRARGPLGIRRQTPTTIG